MFFGTSYINNTVSPSHETGVWVCRITFCHLPFQTKWMYIGTDHGNVHIMNIETFTLSGYAIMWNKAIEL